MLPDSLGYTESNGYVITLVWEFEKKKKSRKILVIHTLTVSSY